MFQRLNTKVVALLLATILMSLAMVGLFFTILMNDLYQASSRDKLQDAANSLRNDLIYREKRLRSLANSLQQDDTLISSVYLIHSYQDPKNYSPLVFDVEKEKLLKIMTDAARRTGVSYLAVHDGNGNLISYIVNTQAIQQSGYYTFKKGVPSPVVRSNAGQSLVIDRLFDNPTGHSNKTIQSSFLVIDTIRSLAAVVVAPLHSGLGTGKKNDIGFVRIAHFLDSDYVRDMSAKLGSQFAIRADSWTNASEDFDPMSHSSPSHELLPRLDFSGGSIALHWEQGDLGQEGAVAVDAGKQDEVQLIFGQSKGDVFASLNTFRSAVLLVIALSALFAVPIGIFFTRRTIADPVEKLTAQAKAIAGGDRQPLHDFRYKGELGTLAESFNVMVASLDTREHQLRSAQREIEAIVGNAPSVIFIKDTEGRYLLVNPEFEKLFGVSGEQIKGKTDFDFFPQSMAENYQRNDQQVLQDLQAHQYEEVAPHADGVRTYLSIKFPLLDDKGKVFAVCGISTDITERKNAENDLMLAKKIIESANEAIVITNVNGIIEDVNPAYEQVTGYSRSEAIGSRPGISQSGRHDTLFYKKMWDEIIQTGKWEGELWDRRKNGELFPAWMSINTVRDDKGRPSHYVGIFNDITSKKETESRLEELAYFDGLTGLPNRSLFRDRLHHEIAACRRHGSRLAVIFIDLDNFKLINDSQGHLAGDKLLEIVGERLQVKGRDTDTVSRLGGDEFTIVLTDINDPESISDYVNGVIEAINEPMNILGQQMSIGASAGVAIYPDDGHDMEALIKNADIALYQAKEQGRNTFRFFSRDLQEKILSRIQLEEDLRRAIAGKEFVLYYQPKYNLLTRQVVGMEALIRWQRDDGEMVMPDEFIPLAEETGLIIEIGELVLEVACRQVSEWERVSGRKLRMAVNLSASQLKMENLVKRVRDIVSNCSLDHDALELELTESMVMENVQDAIGKMEKLRTLGVHLSIDDFGTGYSSLGHLKRFPIDSVKIDKSFIQDLEKGAEDAAIIEAIIAMAEKLNMHVIAEGIETEEQLQFVIGAGCHEGQGYYLGRPMPAEDFLCLLRDEPVNS